MKLFVNAKFGSIQLTGLFVMFWSKVSLTMYWLEKSQACMQPAKGLSGKMNITLYIYVQACQDRIAFIVVAQKLQQNCSGGQTLLEQQSLLCSVWKILEIKKNLIFFCVCVCVLYVFVIHQTQQHDKLHARAH